jgi:CRP-like cAMP-binding protein
VNTSPDDLVTVLHKDDVLFREGDVADTIYLVKQGRILRLKRSGERLVAVGTAGEREVVGEEGLLRGLPHGYSAVATEETQVVTVQGALIEGALGTAPPWMRELFKTLAERYAGTAEAIAEHRISDAALGGGEELPPQEENRLKKLLAGGQ